MSESFLKDIALVLGIAAIIAPITRRFKLPTVHSYMIAGLFVGPYIPLPLLADHHRVESLSEFGVILVMFTIGLEFRLKKLFQVLPTSGIAALLEISMMALVGLSLGYLFGWSTPQAIFLGGALAISSTMIVSKVFEETRPKEDIKEHVFGILIVQDIVAILLLALLGAYAASSQIEISQLLPTLSGLLATLIFFTIAGLFIIPKSIRYISKNETSEVLTIVAMGVCFASATLVEKMGYSVALGAFLAGILIAESGESHKVERLTRPLKDVFAAVFFVSVGMTVNPVIAFEYLPQSLAVTFVIVSFQFLTVSVGGILSGTGARKSLMAGLALGQIGEFAFIIAGIGVSAGLLGPEFQAIIVTSAVLSSICTPILWRKSRTIVSWLIVKMPDPIRIVIGLYEAWFNRLREGSPVNRKRFLGIPKKILIPLILDAVLLIALPPAILKFLPPLISRLFSEDMIIFEGIIVLLVLFFGMAPIFYGFIKSATQFVAFLTNAVFENTNNLDMAATRKLFSFTIWSLITYLTAIPMMSTLSPFAGSGVLLALIVVLVLFTLWRIWKSASEVAHDFESGAERIVSVLRRQTFEVGEHHADENPTTPQETKPIEPKIDIPGLENIEPITVSNKNFIGKTLAELRLRNIAGVTVVSINRNGKRILFPNQDETIQEGDILQIWGDPSAKVKCKKILGNK